MRACVCTVFIMYVRVCICVLYSSVHVYEYECVYVHMGVYMGIDIVYDACVCIYVVCIGVNCVLHVDVCAWVCIVCICALYEYIWVFCVHCMVVCLHVGIHV